MRISRAATFQTCSIGLREPGTEDGTFIAIAVNFLRTGWEELGECRMTTGRKEGAGQDRVGLRKAHRNRWDRTEACKHGCGGFAEHAFFLSPSNTLLLSLFFLSPFSWIVSN